jgi:transposase
VVSLEQARDLRQCILDAIAFYGEHIDCGLLALEIELNLSHYASLQQHLARLDETIASEYQRSYPNDVLQSIPGVG